MFRIAAVLTLLAQPALAQVVYTGSDGAKYQGTQNEHGERLESLGGNVVIFLGKSCDAFSEAFGTGTWGAANGGFAVNFPGREILFSRQELRGSYPNCRL